MYIYIQNKRHAEITSVKQFWNMRQFLTSSTSLSTILIIWSCVIKMKRFLPVMGTVSVWAMVYNVSARAVAPSKAVKITAFCWCGSSFQWSLRRLKRFKHQILMLIYSFHSLIMIFQENVCQTDSSIQSENLSKFLIWNKHKLYELH